eukprot:1467820-Rhodomonas_salina.1
MMVGICQCSLGAGIRGPGAAVAHWQAREASPSSTATVTENDRHVPSRTPCRCHVAPFLSLRLSGANGLAATSPAAGGFLVTV